MTLSFACIRHAFGFNCHSALTKPHFPLVRDDRENKAPKEMEVAPVLTYND